MLSLKTDRLIIRQYEENDLPEYHRLLSDKGNMYFLSDIATNTMEESLASLREAIEINNRGKARRFCIAPKETGRLIGAVGYEIREITPAGKIADPMGWFIMPEFQNKGYVTEAARSVLEFAFIHDDCIKVVTGCYKDNIPTQKVMEKLGFRKETEKISSVWHDGEMKTRVEFAMNKDEFLKLHSM